MRKRRVLAVMLALSLVVSGNGMTVLAAEPVAVGTETPEMTQEQMPGGGDTSGTTEKPEDGGTSETTQKPEEGGASETTETPDESGTGDTTGETGTETPGTTEEPDGNDTPDDPDNTEEQEDPDAPAEDETTDPVEEEPTEDAAEEPVEPAEEPEKQDENAPAVKAYVSRMVTFTDDTGMRVAYDANASTQYGYKVTDGVLTGVVIKTGTTESGNTIEESVKFKGNVELTQPETGEQYTSVAATLFQGNSDITYVKLPAGVETIVEGAFKNCTALKGVYLPAGVKTIGNSAFENCTAMTQISVPKTVTALGNSAFKNDAKLHLVHIKDRDYCDLTTIGESAFEGCEILTEFCSDTSFVMPAKISTIGRAAFKGCKTITKVDFSDTALSSLGNEAFRDCTGLKDLNMGDNLSEIPQYAFAGCSGLMSLMIQDGNDMTIDSHAFENCYALKQLILPQSIKTVQDDAFGGCTNLGRVEVHNFNMNFGTNSRAFPLSRPKSGNRLFIVDRPRANKMSSGEIYARNQSDVADFVYFDGNSSATYTYIVEGEDSSKKDGVIPGGKIWVQTADGKKLRELNGGKGVVSNDTTRYYIYYQANKDFVFVPESLRCNGELVQKDNKGKYYFTMPVGGVIITAEFTPVTTDKISGKTVTVEYSNGEPMANGVSLKVGQTTRMFLIDAAGKVIPSSKIQSINSSNTKVVTVTKNGVITALGTNGKAKAEAEITAIVNGEDGLPVTISKKIVVVDADAASIALKASKYEAQIIDITQSETTGIQTASLTKNNVANSGLEITLKANVYTEEQENISKALTWTTSNKNVATVETAKTDGKNSVNVVQIPRGCEGEATITATAVNAADKKVTQKFIIRVYQQSYKLATTAVTVNPHETSGGEIEVIGAYGQNVSDATVKLWREEKDNKTKQTFLYPDTDFDVTALNNTAGNSIKRFRVKASSKDTVANKTYNLKASLNGNTDTLYPIKITVKRSTPNPTIKFNANKVKFNLFYKNGGVDSEGRPVEVLTEITKLGDAEIERVVLEPLSQKEDDQLFTKNFVVDTENSDYPKGKVYVKRSGDYLKYTDGSKPKAVVTGYLVIYYKGYDESAAKKVKVTMPTCTTLPSWALRTTKGSYKADIGPQDVKLEIYDKKSKTKETVRLDSSNYEVDETRHEITIENGGPKIEDGSIAVRFIPYKERMEFELKNPTEWDKDQKGNDRILKFTYTVNTSSGKPTIKTKQSFVSLNLNCPEQTAEFELVSNLSGVDIADAQVFEAKSTRSNAAQIEKLAVNYQNGVGSVSIKEAYRGENKIKKGTYQFRCKPPQVSVEGIEESNLKEVILTVKVTDSRPSVKFGKGALQLNKVVYYRNNSNTDVQDSSGENLAAEYREIARRTFKVSGKPDGYALASVGEGNDKTKILGTKKNAGAEANFEFSVIENSEQNGEDVLQVSLKNDVLPDKTYEFTMTPRYTKQGATVVEAKPVTFQVKVVDTTAISMSVSAKGKINLVNREGESSDKNGIVYTPSLKNIVGEIEEVKIYDVSSLKESKYFDISMITEGKNAGKFYVTPKKIAKADQGAGSTAYDYVELENNKTYTVRIWAKVKGYAGTDASNSQGGVFTGNIRIKTAQGLPKVTLSRSALDVYLSTKNYDASFVVKPKAGSVGTIEDVYFAEKDEMANDSFELVKTPQEDGSMKVTVHLKEAVSFANGTNNNVKFYVKYKGQGTNTSKTATGFTMKIKVN